MSSTKSSGPQRCRLILQQCLAIQLSKSGSAPEDFWMYDSGYMIFQVRFNHILLNYFWVSISECHSCTLWNIKWSPVRGLYETIIGIEQWHCSRIDFSAKTRTNWILWRGSTCKHRSALTPRELCANLFAKISCYK
jgi:hypothetical protein